MNKFLSLSIESWLQFERISIDFGRRLTVLTGANGSGKTTLLRLLALHRGWPATHVATPARNRVTGAIEFLTRWFKGVDKSDDTKVGTLSYTSGVSANLVIPGRGQVAYQVSVHGQQPVNCIFMPSHRQVFRYEPVQNIPVMKKTEQAAFDEVYSASVQRHHGGGGQSASFFMKSTLIGCPYPKALQDHNYKHPANKAALADSSHHKCMYCESKISHVNFGHVEHIKPKAQDLFPELEFEWTNLGYVCDRCNVAKANKYTAECEFIDPYSEDPANHLQAYGALLLERGASARGELTINELQLNRADLVERRDVRIRAVNRAFSAAARAPNEAVKQSALNELRHEVAPDKEYSAIVEAFLRHLGVLP